MLSLPTSTQHRLQHLPQIPSVWEGDRRSLNSQDNRKGEETGDCILWVDGSEGLVRSLDFVAAESGIEVIVRALLRAMEVPRPPAPPARPKKIVVRNREIQFFLRGALQNLDIAIDYVPELPLIDELFHNFATSSQQHPDILPLAYREQLYDLARQLWQIAPWGCLADHDILSIHMEGEDLPCLYACVMGMLGEEFGIIFYRSLESLQQFRTALLVNGDTEYLERIFCSQDCLFLNYEALEGETEGMDLELLDGDEILPVFGSIHPLEGIRPFLDEEEGQIITYALQGLIEFNEHYEEELTEEPIPHLSHSLRCFALHSQQAVAVTVSTLPQLAATLIEQMEQADEDEDEPTIGRVMIQDNLIPEKSYLSLGMITWEVRQHLHQHPRTYCQQQNVQRGGEGLPVLIVQTSRPKAEKIIALLRQEGGVEGLCFHAGHNSLNGQHYELGIIQTVSGVFYLFGEFLEDNTLHQEARHKWERRCQATQGYCGLLVAMGATGATRGNPQLKDMLGFFEFPFLEASDFNLNEQW